MTTATTDQLKALGANFGNASADYAAHASVGNNNYVRCYNAGEGIWEESTKVNPIAEWTFTRTDGKFHARVITSLGEALRIVADWNKDCPSRAIAEVSNGTITRHIDIQLSLIAA